MTKTKKVLATLATAVAITAGASVIQVPTAEVDQDAFQFQSVKSANGFRRYLLERENHMKDLVKTGEVPQLSLDKATFARGEFEQKLKSRKMIDNPGDQIKEKPKKTESLLKKVSFKAKQAYAYTFGKEDFESCGGGIPCSFTTNSSFASGTATLDATSKVNSTNSMKCHIAAIDDGCSLSKNITGAAEYWYQFYIIYPTGWGFGANGYTALFATGDGVGAPVYCNAEDYGTIRITCNGDEVGYHDTGVDIPLNTKTRVEIRAKVSATVGDIDVWVNNTTVGSPSYNGAGNFNTGTQNMTVFTIGGYSPDVVNDRFYDDAIVNTSFIGTGARRRIINVE